MQSTKSVGIWIRVSTEDQAKGDSPEHHEERARMYAQAKEWNVKEVYHLEGISGKSVMEHPEAKRMLRDIESGHITGLIFSKLARLARNTKELLDFSDYFRKYDADLISLQESIDTSSPAGRLFYTLISAMAQWEREEIADRVKASVPIRAKLGKPLGGEAPFGYAWKDKQLVINEKEAPIRKLMYELFVEHKRKGTVAKELNNRGYRTRKGAKFSDTTIGRWLKDPIAKGVRRVNYSTQTANGIEMKSQDEWIFVPSPVIVSEELWDNCNNILMEQERKRVVPKKTIHLFSGLLHCGCGHKMYARKSAKKYICTNCKSKILIDDMEEIFQEQLKEFVFSKDQIQEHLSDSEHTMKEKEQLLATMQSEAKILQRRLNNLLELYDSGEMPKDGFGKHYTPLYEQLKQIEDEVPKLQGEIDYLKVQFDSKEQILDDAKSLYDYWGDLSQQDKRSIIEVVTNSIIIDGDEITINLSYLPTLSHHHSFKNATKDQQTPSVLPMLVATALQP